MDSPTELGIRALVRLLLSRNAVSDKDRNKAANLLKAHARSERGRYHIVQTGCIQEIVHLLLDPDVVVSVCCLCLATGSPLECLEIKPACCQDNALLVVIGYMLSQTPFFGM